MLLVFFSDGLRQLHLGVNCYIPAAIIEMVNFGNTGLWSWLLAVKLDLQFKGVLLSLLCSQSIGYCAYILNFCVNKSFREVKNFMCVRNRKREPEEDRRKTLLMLLQNISIPLFCVYNLCVIFT